MGALPAGYCPQDLQQLANDIASRLIVTLDQSYGLFVSGPNQPTSNVGGWFKNCEEWFFWDDTIGGYRPVAKGGFNTMQYLTASATFTVPAFIYRLRATLWGAGGGGGGGGNVRSGGGGGGMCMGYFAVSPGQAIPFVLGAGGAGVGAGVGNAGGNSTFLTMTANGGGGGNGVTNGGLGGTALGGSMNISGGAGAFGTLAGEVSGQGGDAARGGSGGADAPNAAGTAWSNGAVPGGGGAGSANNAAYSVGSGAGGALLLEY